MKTLLARSIALSAFFTLATMLYSQAQGQGPSRVALRVSGLTSEERDQLNSDLRERGDLRISFACVPAGILIVEPIEQDRSADSVRAMAASALIRRVPLARRSEVQLTQAEAETLCAEARNNR